jgi:hypothetical protein
MLRFTYMQKKILLSLHQIANQYEKDFIPMFLA